MSGTAGADGRLKVAIVGNGGIAPRHAEAYAATGTTELVGVADIVPDRAEVFGARYGTPNRYDGVEALLAAQSPDLVSIATPPGTHTELALAVLAAGHSVLLEKPPCLSLAEMDLIAAAEADSAGEVYVVVQHRHGSGARRAKRLIDAGALGRPQVALCETLWFRPDSYFDPDWRGTWSGEGGGPTLGHGIHQIDLLLHLLGDWTSISALATRVARPVEFEDVSVAAVTFASGAVGSVVNSLLSPRELSRLRFDLTGGTLEVDHVYGYRDSDWSFTPAPDAATAGTFGIDPGVRNGSGGPGGAAGAGGDAAASDPWAASAGVDVPSNHGAQISRLVADMLAGRRHETTLASTRPTMSFVTALYASALLARPVAQSELVPANPFYASLSGRLPLDEVAARMTPAGGGRVPLVPVGAGAPAAR